MPDNHKKDTLIDQLTDLKGRGFIDGFTFSPDGMKDITTNKVYHAGEVSIIEHHRFEGESSADDASVVYAIETTDGQKGVIIDSFGMYANPVIGEFLKKVEEHQYKQIDDIR